MNQDSHRHSLTMRVVRGAAWTLGSSSATMVLRLVSNLIMTRFLLPEAFGMMALATILQTAVELVTDIGIRQSVIRERDGDTPHFLQVAWTIHLIRGGLVALGMCGIALLVLFLGSGLGNPESAIRQPEMPLLIALMSFDAVFRGATSTNWFLALRRMDYRRIELFEVGVQFLVLLLMVLLVQIFPTIWTLLAGMLFGSFLKMAISHVALPGPRMRFSRDKEVSSRVWNFGKWIMASSILNYVSTQADTLFLGVFLGATTYGVYTIAYTWLQALLAMIRRLSNQIGYSAFSEVLNSRPERLGYFFARYMRAMSVISIAGAVGCFLFAKPIMHFLYPDRFVLAGTYLQLMAPSLLFMRFLAHMELLTAAGESRMIAVSSLIRGLTICMLVPLAYALFGIEGAIVSAIFSRNAAIPFILFHTAKKLERPQILAEIVWYLFAVGVLVTIPSLN